jgi:hypothetical protein
MKDTFLYPINKKAKFKYLLTPTHCVIYGDLLGEWSSKNLFIQNEQEVKKGKISTLAVLNYLRGNQTLSPPFYEVFEKLQTNPDYKLWILVRDPYRAKMDMLLEAFLSPQLYSHFRLYLPNIFKNTPFRLDKFPSEKVMDDIVFTFLANHHRFLFANQEVVDNYTSSAYTLLTLLPDKQKLKVGIVNLDTLDYSKETSQFLTEHNIFDTTVLREVQGSVTGGRTYMTNILSKWAFDPQYPGYLPATVALCDVEADILKLIEEQFKSNIFHKYEHKWNLKVM